MVTSLTKVRFFVQGVICVGVGEIARVGVAGTKVITRGRGVVVGSGSVGGDLVGGRNGVEVTAGAQAVSNHRQTKMNTDSD